MVNEPIPIKCSPNNGVEYFAYSCVQCGKEARNTYCEPYRTRMLERRLCFSCNHWRDFEEKHTTDKSELTIIDGHLYGPGNRTSGSMRGMAGRRFDLEYIEPSPHAGKRITTFDLWSGGYLPDHLKPKFPDTAKFLNGAERARVGETTCWDASNNKSEPYPPPSSIGIGLR